MFDISPPFGAYALPPAREAWRKKASAYKDTRIGYIRRKTVARNAPLQACKFGT